MLRRLTIGAGVLLLVGAAVLALAWASLDRLLKHGIERVGSRLTDVPVGLSGVSWSVVNGQGLIEGLTVGNPVGYTSPTALVIGTIRVEWVPASWFTRRWHFRSIRMEQAEITYENRGGESNLEVILAGLPASAGAGSKGWRSRLPGRLFRVDELVFTGTRLQVRTPATGGEAVWLEVADLCLTDLGRESPGVTAAELLEQTLGVLLGLDTQPGGRVANP